MSALACKTKSLLLVFAVLFMLLASSNVNAQDPQIRASLSAQDSVWVGQQVTLVVELLAPGYFASAASFDLPDPDGVLLMPPEGHPMLSNETVEGTEYTVQRHELRVWPMRAGEVNIPAVTARFSYKPSPLDKVGIAASVTTEALVLSVQVPPGAENLGTVISARHLEFTESWEPEPGEDAVAAGTAFKRTIRFSAPDVPGMVFPPFPADPIRGLGVYRKQQLLDHEDRGSFTGARNDEVTYVCKTPGQYTIPATRFTWYDLDSGTLKVEEFPARTLNVMVNPALAAGSGESAEGPPAPIAKSWSWLVWPFALLVVLAPAALLLGSKPPRLQSLSDRWNRLVGPLRPVHLQPLNPSAAPD